MRAADDTKFRQQAPVVEGRKPSAQASASEAHQAKPHVDGGGGGACYAEGDAGDDLKKFEQRAQGTAGIEPQGGADAAPQDAPPLHLSTYDVIEIKKFAEYKSQITAYLERLQARPEVDAFAGFRGVDDEELGMDEATSLWGDLDKNLDEIMAWQDEVDVIDAEADSFEVGDMERLRKVAKEASEREMSPDDTDIIEIAVQTLVALDALLRMLTSRRKALDLLRARIMWEQQRKRCWTFYSPLAHDLDTFVESKSRWSTSVYRRSIESNVATSSTASLTTPLLSSSSHASISSVATSGGTTPSGHHHVRQLAASLKTESAMLARRCFFFANELVPLAGRRLDDIIELNKVPETFLDEQDRLEDLAESIKSRQLFVVQLNLQWVKADELFRHFRALHIEARETNAAYKETKESAIEHRVLDKESLADRAQRFVDVLSSLVGKEEAQSFLERQHAKDYNGREHDNDSLSLKPKHGLPQPACPRWPMQQAHTEMVGLMLQHELEAAARHARIAVRSWQKRARDAGKEAKEEGSEVGRPKSRGAETPIIYEPAGDSASGFGDPMLASLNGMPDTARRSASPAASPAASETAPSMETADQSSQSNSQRNARRSTPVGSRPFSKEMPFSAESYKQWPTAGDASEGGNLSDQRGVRNASQPSRRTSSVASRSTSGCSVTEASSLPRTPQFRKPRLAGRNSSASTSSFSRADSFSSIQSRTSSERSARSKRSSQKERRAVSEQDAASGQKRTPSRLPVSLSRQSLHSRASNRSRTPNTPAGTRPSSRSPSAEGSSARMFRQGGVPNLMRSASAASGRPGKPNAYRANPKSKLDVEVGKIVNQLPVRVEITHAAEADVGNGRALRQEWHDISGKYWVGYPNPRLCFCRILPSETVMVRIGGGWEELSRFVMKHHTHLVSTETAASPSSDLQADGQQDTHLSSATQAPSLGSDGAQQERLPSTPRTARRPSEQFTTAHVAPVVSTPRSTRSQKESPQSPRIPRFSPMGALDISPADVSPETM